MKQRYSTKEQRVLREYARRFKQKYSSAIDFTIYFLNEDLKKAKGFIKRYRIKKKIKLLKVILKDAQTRRMSVSG